MTSAHNRVAVLHGVSFNVYGDARGLDRPWPLDPVPVVLAPDEFAALADELMAQRAESRLGETMDVQGWIGSALILIAVLIGAFSRFIAGELLEGSAVVAIVTAATTT